uniref:Uncharacterized protein n=1 Tax=Xenopsylla cheopis TaxID=163159 RepID=A0A6M2DY18_XENCH
MIKLLILCFIILTLTSEGFAIYCYRCTSATPGCGQPFNWRGIGYLGQQCPEDNDICVKLIERKGASEIITRDCLSALKAFRTDIPPDNYEGCRPAVVDVKLANYVNNSIKELDIHRNFYDSTTWCFCFLDHRCNKSSTLSFSVILLFVMVLITKFLY